MRSEMMELKRELKKKVFRKCYLFTGEETYLIQQYEKILVEGILGSAERDMNYDLLEGNQAQAETILNIAETIPFFTERRMLVVRESHFFEKAGRKAEGEKLLSFIKAIPESTCVLFIEEKVEKNNQLYKEILNHGNVVWFHYLSENDLRKWFILEAKRKGYEIEMRTAVYFMQNITQDMYMMQNELEKLCAFQQEEPHITIAHIQAVSSPSLETKIFNLVRAVGEGDPHTAIQIYKQLLLEKQSPYLILNLITTQFRNIVLVTLFQKHGKTNVEIEKLVGIRNFVVKQCGIQGKRFSEETLKRMLKDCLNTEMNIKNGLVKEELAVEILIMQYAGSLRRMIRE